MWPVTLPGSWVASTKPEAVIARRECDQPFQGRGRTLAPRDRGPGSMADVAGYITKVAAVAGRRDWTRETLAAGVREGDRRGAGGPGPPPGELAGRRPHGRRALPP